MKKYVSGAMIIVTAAALLAAVPALAQTNKPAGMMRQNDDNNQGRAQNGMMRPGIVGSVSAVSGNTITVLGHAGFGPNSATTTFSVDATNAKITKNNATSSVSNIAVGDLVAVQGTISGTNVQATMIRDGIKVGPGIGFGRGGPEGPGKPGKPGQMMGSTTPAFIGNGQPVIAGTISTVGSSTITVTNKSNVTYTVDVSGAKILQGNASSSLANLKTGDTVLVQGAINGSSITASTVIDQTKPAADPGKADTHPGFFSGIGQFFMHLFGF